MLLTQEISQVCFAGHSALIRVRLFKRLTKNPEQVFEERHIRVGEYFVGVPHSCIHINFTPDLFDLLGQL